MNEFIMNQSLNTSKTVIALVECPQIWNKAHKIRIQVRNKEELNNISDDSVEGDHSVGMDAVSSKATLTAKECSQQIMHYIRDNSDRSESESESESESGSGSNLQDSDIRINVYHPNGDLMSLLDPSIAENEVEDTFGTTRIRCVVDLCNTTGLCLTEDNNSNSRDVLLLKGRYFDYNPNGMDYAGKTLIVREQVNNREEDGTGLNVWDGSLLLARYLERNPEHVKEKTVLELGSGPGLVGIAAALLDAKEVILSDLEYTLPLINSNVSLNDAMINKRFCKKIECVEIDWFDPPESKVLCSQTKVFPQVMLIADCVWLEDLVNPLMNTVEKLCHKHTNVVITYQRRGRAAHDLFWKRLRGIFSSIENVDTMERCSLDKPESICLLICRI